MSTAQLLHDYRPEDAERLRRRMLEPAQVKASPLTLLDGKISGTAVTAFNALGSMNSSFTSISFLGMSPTLHAIELPSMLSVLWGVRGGFSALENLRVSYKVSDRKGLRVSLVELACRINQVIIGGGNLIVRPLSLALDFMRNSAAQAVVQPLVSGCRVALSVLALPFYLLLTVKEGLDSRERSAFLQQLRAHSEEKDALAFLREQAGLQEATDDLCYREIRKEWAFRWMRWQGKTHEEVGAAIQESLHRAGLNAAVDVLRREGVQGERGVLEETARQIAGGDDRAAFIQSGLDQFRVRYACKRQRTFERIVSKKAFELLKTSRLAERLEGKDPSADAEVKSLIGRVQREARHNLWTGRAVMVLSVLGLGLALAGIIGTGGTLGLAILAGGVALDLAATALDVIILHRGLQNGQAASWDRWLTVGISVLAVSVIVAVGALTGVGALAFALFAGTVWMCMIAYVIYRLAQNAKDKDEAILRALDAGNFRKVVDIFNHLSVSEQLKLTGAIYAEAKSGGEWATHGEWDRWHRFGHESLSLQNLQESSPFVRRAVLGRVRAKALFKSLKRNDIELARHRFEKLSPAMRDWMGVSSWNALKVYQAVQVIV
jgi:hypothetical protein